MSATSIVARLWVMTTKSIDSAQLAQRVGEAADVRLVERGVDLVEDAERDRVDGQHGEEQRDAGQRALPARQHGQALQALAGRPNHDLDPARRIAVALVRQLERGRAAGEQEPAVLVELLADGAECGVELGADLGVEGRDQLLGRRDRGAQVGVLGRHLLQACGQLAMLLDREGVDRADLCQRTPHAAQLGLEGLVVERLDLVGGRLRGRLDLRQALERELALAQQCGERLVAARCLDRGRLRRALELAQAGAAAALLALEALKLGPALGMCLLVADMRGIRGRGRLARRLERRRQLARRSARAASSTSRRSGSAARSWTARASRVRALADRAGRPRLDLLGRAARRGPRVARAVAPPSQLVASGADLVGAGLEGAEPTCLRILGRRRHLRPVAPIRWWRGRSPIARRARPPGQRLRRPPRCASRATPTRPLGRIVSLSRCQMRGSCLAQRLRGLVRLGLRRGEARLQLADGARELPAASVGSGRCAARRVAASAQHDAAGIGEVALGR